MTVQDERPPRDESTGNSYGPFIAIAVVASILALAVAFTAAQDDGRIVYEASTKASKTLTKAGVSPPSERLASLPDATAKNTDMTMTKFDPVTKPVKAGPKTFDLVTTEAKVNVKGKVYEMWMFNGSVPGPTMRVVQGDMVTINIKNAGDSTYVHSIDYHASRLSGGGGYVQVAPGKTGTFTFKAEYPGVFMYHCGTPPILHHIGLGMYGMLIVQPKEGFGEKMPEYAFTQSELYGSISDLERSLPTQMAFNGLPGQYMETPISLDPNQKVRLFILNAGPNELSSFHVVGTVMDRALDDGNPRNASFGRQTVLLGASSGLVAEMKLVGEGHFPFVTHQFDHGAMGAGGQFITGDGNPVGDDMTTMKH